MSYYSPEGSKFYFSTTFAAAKSVTIATNANPAVLTAVGHGIVDAEEFLFKSGWEDATDSIFKADTLTVDTISPLGLNTTDTNLFASGTGTGTIQKVSSWLEIPQVLGISPSGGGGRFMDINPLAKRNGLSIPIGFEPTKITLNLGHDPNGANYATMLDIGRTRTLVAYKQVLGGGAAIYGYGYMLTSEVPSQTAGQPNQVQTLISFQGRCISY